MVKAGLEPFVHYKIPTQCGSLDELALFSTEKPDIAHDGKLATLVEFVEAEEQHGTLQEIMTPKCAMQRLVLLEDLNYTMGR